MTSLSLQAGSSAPPALNEEAVGWRIKLFWGADGAWYEAEVLSYDDHKHRHHVLYLDGEEEWVALNQEMVVWLKASRHGAVSAGALKRTCNGSRGYEPTSCAS